MYKQQGASPRNVRIRSDKPRQGRWRTGDLLRDIAPTGATKDCVYRIPGARAPG